MSVRLLQDPVVAHMAAAAGFEALYVDLEHSLIPPDKAASVCLTASSLGMKALIRLRDATASGAAPLLDAGVDGLIVPGIEDLGSLRDVVDACRFAPGGRRSINWTTPLTGYRRPSDPRNFLASRPYLAVMVESREAVSLATELAASDGVDMLFVGCGDLSLALGLEGQVDHPEIREACRLVAEACHTAGRDVAIGGATAAPALVSQVLALGPAMITGGSDNGLLAAALTAQAASMKSINQP